MNGFTAGAGGDVLDLDTATAAVTLIGADQTDLGAVANYFVSGSFNASTGVFTVAADGTGSDTLIIDQAANGGANVDITTAGNIDDAVVLVGVDTDNLVAANIA